MPLRLLLGLATVTLLVALAPLGAQPRPDSVSLRFDWTPGTTARVDNKWTRVQVSAAKRDSFEVNSSYRIQVLQHAEGRLVRTDSFRMGQISGLPAMSGDAANSQRMALQLSSIHPSYVVSTEGEFRRLEGMTELKRLLDSLFAPVLAQLEGAPPQARALLQTMTSDQALTASAAQEWNAIAGTWVGADWIVGEAYESNVEEPVPILPGVNIPMHYEFSASERVPCEQGQARKLCVRLRMFSEPDTAGLRRLTTELLQKLGAEQREIVSALQNMRSENELEVVAEPKTLRPYSVTRTQRVSVQTAASGNEPGGKTTRLDVKRATYRYSR